MENFNPAVPPDYVVIQATRDWLERAVIGLNLCPFAKAVHARGQIRYVVSDATGRDALLADLKQELQALSEVDPNLIDTTLLIHPGAMGDFLEYNDFLTVADRAVRKLRLDGVIQIASFHPNYQFAGSMPDDIANFTNRAPFPLLHLLRESSVERAVAANPDASKIVERNLSTLRHLGLSGWNALFGEAQSNAGCSGKDA